jgi:hypothetical protein
MSLPPITEEDKPAVEKIIQQLVRLRKRQVSNSTSSSATELSDAIKALHDFGAMKGWWKYEF